MKFGWKSGSGNLCTPVKYHGIGKLPFFDQRYIFKCWRMSKEKNWTGWWVLNSCLPQQNSRCFIQVVELLLSAAASPTLLDSRGQSPLHMAGPASISKLLLARAQVDQQDTHQMNQGALGFR